RFATEVWDLTLQNTDDEIAVDLFKHYTADIDYKKGEGPKAELYLCLLRGDAKLRIDTYHTFSLQANGPAVFTWDSFRQATGPHKAGSVAIWKKEHPSNEFANPMFLAVRELNELAAKEKVPLETALQNGLDKDRRESKLQALYSYAAIDDLNKLID